MNNKGKPPVNTKESNKLQGCTTPSVELLGLQSVVRKMKTRPRNYGSMAVAKEINETILKDSEDKVSSMAINRWWQKHKDDDDPSADIVNIYSSHLDSLKSIARQLEMIEMYIEELNANVDNVDEVVKVAKEVNGLMATYDKLSMRKSALLGLIGDIQAKVYTYQNFGIVLDTVMAEVELRDAKLHFDIVEKLKKDPLLAEVIRRIKEETK